MSVSVARLLIRETRFAATGLAGTTRGPKIPLPERRVMYIGVGAVLLVILIILLIILL